MTTTHKILYRFGPEGAEGGSQDKGLLGGKGANLAEMANTGVPVPPGFTITTEVCNHFQTKPTTVMKRLWQKQHLHKALEELRDQFGYMPLVSVRSGAPKSMPGMMDTILNVGLTPETLPIWKERIGERAALDSYRRLIQMMGSVAFGVEESVFAARLQEVKTKYEADLDSDLSVKALNEVVDTYQAEFSKAVGFAFPSTVETQIDSAIRAVFGSWNNERAVEYRTLQGLDHNMGTAVNVQAMVFGNLGDDSGTGVLFTRNPSTGEDEIMGEFLPNAQGEDVVAGVRTPYDMKGMGQHWPEATTKLLDVVEALETSYRDMMDVEFTIQKGELFILQCRAGKRSALAAFRIFKSLADQGLAGPSEMPSYITRDQARKVRRPRIDDDSAPSPSNHGIGAGMGVAVGRPVFSSHEAVNAASAQESVILVAHETTPEDIKGMSSAEGVLTLTGGATSHAAVVARSMDKPCVTGCADLDMTRMKSAKQVTICAETGRVWLDDAVPVIDGGNDPAVVWAFDTALSCAHLTPKVTSVSDIDSQYGGRVYMHDVDYDRDALKALLEQAPAQGSSPLQIDLTAPRHFCPQEDHTLLTCFGDEAMPSSKVPSELISVLAEAAETDAASNVVIICPDDVAEKIQSLGFSVAREALTLRDLFHGGVFQLTPRFLDTVLGSKEAADWVAASLEKEGVTITMLREAGTKEYALFRMLA